MRKARCKGSFYQVNIVIRRWSYILIGSIFGSTMLYAAAGVANPVATRQDQTTANSNYGGSLGQSLLNNLLGGNALRPQNSGSGVTNTGKNQPVKGVAPPSKGSAAQLAQAPTFPDIQSHWAKSFIEVLAARGIIRGFPDGTFRPDDLVTRAQFAAMIRQAFQQRAVKRTGNQFVDVPTKYWGYEAIQAAYRLGFLQGYPNNVFVPEQNIPRVQALVSLANGLDLPVPSDVASVLNSKYQDSAQIPNFAQNSVAAATLNQLVVNYPNIALLNPNQTATRADVAAFIYQALVKEGSLPPLGSTDVASQYIIGYTPPVATPPPSPQISPVADLRQQYQLPEPPVIEQIRRIFGGGSSISTPTAFGAQNGNVFLGGTYQQRTRFTDVDDGAVAVGFGLGDARKLVALETTATSFSTFRQGFWNNGGVSFKVHRTFPGDWAVALGVENAINWGDNDSGSSIYGVATKVFRLRENQSEPLSRVTASVGLGGGRFRSQRAIEEGDTGSNFFGSVGVQVVEPVSMIAEWTGQDLNIGASITPFPGVPLVITPAAADITNTAGDGARFILGVGYGISF